ncbi:MAG: hypothetical protein LBJ83_00805 [Oscillospiraceae bacterium]|nr:hypothetical protein [Oscillospiraceae bacterium]
MECVRVDGGAEIERIVAEVRTSAGLCDFLTKKNKQMWCFFRWDSCLWNAI